MAKRIDIKGKVAGDDLRVHVTVTGIPAGQTVVKAWLTIKSKRSDADNQAIAQKILTAGFSHTGTDPVTATWNFDLTAGDTAICKPQTTYEYDIQVKTSTGLLDTPITGQIVFEQGVTAATS